MGILLSTQEWDQTDDSIFRAEQVACKMVSNYMLLTVCAKGLQ